MMSAPAAASFGVLATDAPIALKASHFLGVRFQTVSSTPLRRMLAATPAPMRPKPTTATRFPMIVSLKLRSADAPFAFY